MKNLVSRFVKDESGATAIEYALIAGLISVVMIAGLQMIRPELDRIFKAIGTALQGAAPV